MASVFLSYDRDDADAARVIAGALEKAGHSVWWDLHVRGGAQFSKVIEEALKAADAVVVLWSAQSIDSAWVRDEAAAGRDSGRLIPATIDGTDAPLGFRQFQTIDLTDWKRGARASGFRELEQAIAETAGTPPSAASAQAASVAGSARAIATSRRRARSPWLPVAAIALVLLTACAVLLWRFSGRSSSVPIVAVAPAEHSARAEALSRDLLVKLGSLRSAKTDAVRLTAVAAGTPAKADFIFEAAGGNDPQNANLALVAGKDQALLWSKDFSVPGGNQTALEQSMAYTAGQVLDCALQASAPSAHLDEQTLKLFLNGCALFAERYRSDSASVIPIFLQIVASAPRFQPAWSRLLLAEAQNTRAQAMFYDRFVPGALPEHIRQAQRLNSRLPEIFVAEAALLPVNAYDQRLRLFDQAVQLNPDSPELRIVRAEILQAIGRNSDALDDSKRAAELNPLSAGYRSNLIQVLAYSDQVPVAEEELRSAEQMWPASSTIEDARFRLHSRYGDPRDALVMVRSPEFHQYYPTRDMEAFLLARINPTSENVQRAIAGIQSAHLAEGRKLVQTVMLLADFGRDNELYEMLMALPPDRVRFVSQIFYRPDFRRFRRNPRFMQVEQRAGMFDFWRKTGKWPDFCFEADLPYDCKKEAAKLGGATS